MTAQVALSILEKLCRLGLGGLFMYSAWMKIDDPGMFADSVNRYEVLPECLVGIFSLAMPMLELVAGAALVFTKWVRESALLVSGMLALFIVALAQALARGLEISCGCFGVPSVGGRAEIVLALVRDIVLIVPAIWLMFRRNVPIWSRLRSQTAGLMVILVLAPVLSAAALSASRGPVRPGEWNLNFTNVLATAQRESKPMVLIQVGEGCSYCKRLEKAIDGEAFRLWRQDRAPLMAYVRDMSAMSPPEVVAKSAEFVESISTNLVGYPYVCVYWPRGDKTNRVAFCGRREEMERNGAKKNKRLIVEFMSELDRALADEDGGRVGKMTISEIVKKSTRKVSVKAAGDGTVSMSPASGVLTDSGTVVMTAKPRKGNVFVGWWRPDGKACGWLPKLEVRGSMPAGCYQARFRPRADCQPPKVLSPESTTLNIRVFDMFKHAIRVDDACRPVSFRLKEKGSLPFAVNLNPSSGVLYGRLHNPVTNDVEIVVVGSDPARTEKTVKVSFVALPPRQSASRIERDDDEDDEVPNNDDTPKKKEDE